MIINPYDLLGVTINSSSSEVKKAYYELALIMHPDKGGQEGDMITLQRAYEFVMYELSQTKTTDTYETLQAAFEQFCKVQEDTVPMFSDIYAEAFDVPKFNEYFNSNASHHGIWMASYDQGYGELMEQSGVFELAPHAMTLQHSFSNALIEYTSPQETHGGFPTTYDYSESNHLEDFTCKAMYDYRQTFSQHDPIEYDKEDQCLQRTLASLEKEREELLHPSSSNACIWSYRGFIDSQGNRIKDYKSLSLM